MGSLNQQQFLADARHIAFYGLKRSGKGYAMEVLSGLQRFRPELEITAIHPQAAQLAGVPTATSASQLESAPDCALIALKPVDTRRAIIDAASAGVRRAWLVLGAFTPETSALAREHNIAVVEGCPLLFIPGGTFPHNVHRWLAQRFGKL